MKHELQEALKRIKALEERVTALENPASTLDGDPPPPPPPPSGGGPGSDEN